MLGASLYGVADKVCDVIRYVTPMGFLIQNSMTMFLILDNILLNKRTVLRIVKYKEQEYTVPVSVICKLVQTSRISIINCKILSYLKRDSKNYIYSPESKLWNSCTYSIQTEFYI